jgi:thiamine-phosphate pyrophosphorylase
MRAIWCERVLQFRTASIIIVVPDDVSPSGPVLRLIDANANRAREGLRVVEDYARFILNHEPLTRDIKNIRHDLAQILGPVSPEAILHRDTLGDVGTTIKTPAEHSRTDLADVVTAAAKRTGEALRAIEEFLKTIAPPDASKVEALRYRFYDIERQIALGLRPQTQFANVKLYVLITESACKRPWLETAELAIRGGADCLQLREKDLSGSELLRRAEQLKNLCRKSAVPCIINDRADIALAAGADGVHLGQDDIPISAARRILGNRAIIGISTHNIDQARRAVADGADYIGVGPIFKSYTKSCDFLPGLEYAAAAAREIAVPKIGIAGIGPQNVDKVMAVGLKAIAVTAAVTGASDPAAAARELKAKLLM